MRRCLLWPHVPGARVSIWKLLFINSSTWWLYYPSGCLLSLRHWGSNRWGAVRYADINIGRSTFSEYQTDSLLHLLLLLQPSVFWLFHHWDQIHMTPRSGQKHSLLHCSFGRRWSSIREHKREKKNPICAAFVWNTLHQWRVHCDAVFQLRTP